MRERRHLPRTTLEAISSGAVACVRIEPDIVAVILDICGEGLGFQCMTPVERNGTIRFSLMQRERCVDGCGELAWLDATGTSGGLRFTSLTAEASEQISEWTTRSSASTGEVQAAIPIAEPISLGEPGSAAAPSSVTASTGEEETPSHLVANRAANQHYKPLRSRKTPRSIWFWSIGKRALAATRLRLARRWQAMLDPLRLEAISAEIEQIFADRYRARLKAATAEEQERLLAEFLKDKQSLEQERLAIASRRAVRTAEKYKIYIPSDQFKYNHESNTFILPEPDRLHLEQRIMKERRLRAESRALWVGALFGAIVALALVWLATMLKGH